MRLRSARSLSLAVSLLSLSAPAAAGPVSQVARGVENKVETHKESGSGGSSGDGSSDSRDDDSDDHDGSCDDCGGGPVNTDDGADYTAVLVPWMPGPGRLDLYLGGQSVIDSQGAVIGEIRASKDWLGVSAAGTSYFERVSDKRGADTVRMDLMALTLSVRLMQSGPTEVWVDGGLGASSSTEYETILGTAFGARAEHQLMPRVALVGQGRFFRLEYDVSAFEGWVGLRAWILSAGYRAVRFNVGPPLHGPEAGLAVRF